MDPLSQVVELLQPRAVAWQVIEAHEPWGLQFPASKVVIFGQVIEGTCRVGRDDGMRLELGAGDFLLMAAPPAWTMRSSGEPELIEFKRAFDDPQLLKRVVGEGAVTRFIAGRFSFALSNADFLARLMLPVVHVKSSEVNRGQLGTLLGILGDEALADRPGRSLVSNRLLEILLVEALRQPSTQLVGAGTGLLAGLADPRLGIALRAMHDDVQRPWRVEDLAERAYMSRSAFAARFSAVVGTSPIDYLISWRMAMAQNALVTTKLPMSKIAEMIGYQSVSAFSVAFNNATRLPPSAYRKRYS